MLGLGSGIQYPSGVSAIKLSLYSVIVLADDDENVMVQFVVNDADTKAALLSGITQATGAKVNGTCLCTVSNRTNTSDIKTASDTFNIFQYESGGLTDEVYYFLSLATSNITISSDADYKAVDFTAGTFIGDSIDASGAGDVYNISCVISIPGFDDSDSKARNNVSIDAA